MNSELIVMLTCNDETVENAFDLFKEMKDTPVKHWGFKDVGLPKDEMKELVQAMLGAEKTTYLEVVSLTEDEGLEAAKLAVESGFDVLMGTVFFDSINEYLKDKSLAYYPFSGHVHGRPSVLEGHLEDIVSHAQQLEDKGVDGLDLLTYRYRGDGTGLLHAVVEATNIPVVSAGSVASYERINEVSSANAWGFTIGTAFFEGRFVVEGSFRDNVTSVLAWLQAEPASD